MLSSLPPQLSLDHLERDGVRPKMLEQWGEELASLEASSAPRHTWPFGAYLTPAGWDHYLDVMPIALTEHDMAWLAAEMSDQRYWLTHHTYVNSRGRHITARVPRNALATLAYGEFNTTYVRAVATLARDAGVATCIIYRAAPAWAPRDSCSYMEGAAVSVSAVLDGHRAYMRAAGQSEISVPAGPNCHHSIQIAEWSS
jgi:hypothetical protein